MIRGGWRFMGHKTVAAIYQQIAVTGRCFSINRVARSRTVRNPAIAHRVFHSSSSRYGARSACIMA